MRKNKTLSIKEAHMNTLADRLVSIQTSQDAAPSMPSWFGARCSDRRVSTAPRRVLTKICERVRGCRADAVCQYEVIDFLAVQIALRASSANADFQLSPRDCGPKLAPTCAWFDRDRLRARSTLSRDFSALTKEPGRAPCAPCFSTICERSPLSRREANRWSGGSRGRHSGDLRYRWHA